MRPHFFIKPVMDDPNQLNIVCQSCKHEVRMALAEIQDVMISIETPGRCCANCGAPYCDRTEDTPKPVVALNNEFVKFGKTVQEVMSHRGKAEDIDLDANIGFILLDKYEKKGLRSFSKPERHVYSIQAMTREVNNGGFDQFFYNSSGELAFDLVPALTAIGSIEALPIAQAAVERFGKPRSLSSTARAKHLAKVTRDGEERLWEDLDSSFYDIEEDIEPKTLAYIAAHIDSFVS